MIYAIGAGFVVFYLVGEIVLIWSDSTTKQQNAKNIQITSEPNCPKVKYAAT